jgi:hypothetical protein
MKPMGRVICPAVNWVSTSIASPFFAHLLSISISLRCAGIAFLQIYIRSEEIGKVVSTECSFLGDEDTREIYAPLRTVFPLKCGKVNDIQYR